MDRVTPTRTAAIKAFLTKHALPDLAALYNKHMEVQVNVHRANGTPVVREYEGRSWNEFTNGVESWKPFRIPRNANTVPEDNDGPMTFDLETYAQGIGMTGWNWYDKQSLWVAFDFDSIATHKGSGLSEQELANIKELCQNIDWVTVRRSASGNGLHLYVFLEEMFTANHTEHAALARYILGMMSAEAGYNFHNSVDICGGNMWVWHSKGKGNPLAFQCVKLGTTLRNIPDDWRMHIPVAAGKTKKVSHPLIGDGFNQLAGQSINARLDEEHRRLITFLQSIGVKAFWDADHNMLVTHTAFLARAFKELDLTGTFETVATGKDPNDHNCFCFPLRNGAWLVRRYGKEVTEHPTWGVDSNGWVYAYLNRTPDFVTACKSAGGLETSTGFMFQNGHALVRALSLLKIPINLDAGMLLLPYRLNKLANMRLQIVTDRPHHLPQSALADWVVDGNKIKRILSTNIELDKHDRNLGDYDNVIRHLTSPSGEDLGWVVNSNGWRREPLAHVKLSLLATGIGNKSVDAIIGDAVQRPWVAVVEPFQPEYPGNRRWNRDAPQLRFVPAPEGGFSSWAKLLDHVGKSLDEPLQRSVWGQNTGVLTGAAYLKCWIASMIQQPKEPLPYLFLWGPQNSGKSIFHEAIAELLTSGVVRADAALRSQSGFNAELEGAVLCVVEEVNLDNNEMAANRIKDWVTSRTLSVHRKGQTPYTTQNVSHWIQCANSRNYCPVFPGDSRIVVLYVPEIPLEEQIPKRKLIEQLLREAPRFTYELLNLQLPESPDRLALPVIRTSDKESLEAANRSPVEVFFDEHCYHVDGSMVTLQELHDAYLRVMDGKHRLSKQLLRAKLPPTLVSTKMGNDIAYLNLSLDPNAKPGKRLILVGGVIQCEN